MTKLDLLFAPEPIAESSNRRAEIRELDAQIRELESQHDNAANTDERARLRRKAVPLAQERDALLETLAELEDLERQAATRSGDYLFFQANAVRVSAIVILIFLGQHLMVLARYQYRLAAFYRARCNIVRMAMEDIVSWTSMTSDEFEQRMRVFSPEDIGYGRTPRSAVDATGDLAKSVKSIAQREK